MTEHLNASKEYKEGQSIKCVVLDIDFEKEIMDLSEKLAESTKKEKQNNQVKVGH